MPLTMSEEREKALRDTCGIGGIYTVADQFLDELDAERAAHALTKELHRQCRDRIVELDEMHARTKDALADMETLKAAIGSSIYEIHSMLVAEPLQADNARTFSEALHELRVEAEKVIIERQQLAQSREVAAKLAEALDGLLPLTQKMFGMLEQTASIGITRMKPKGVTFDDLRYVQRSREALSLYAAHRPAEGTK